MTDISAAGITGGIGNNTNTRADLTIRDAVAAELPAIIALTLAANEQYATNIGPEWWTSYQPNVIEALTKNASHLIVALKDGRLAGSVLLVPPEGQSSGRPEIRLLAVAPDFRGAGIGRALTEECLRRVAATGTPEIQLHTMEAMHTARQMYERMGFVRAPDEDFSPVEGITVLGYTRVLSQD